MVSTAVSTADRVTLHYLFDPFCGWCYAAAPQVALAAELSEAGLRIVLHAGGMMMGRNRQAVTAQLREFVLPHDARIEALSGQPFSVAYREGLLRDTGAVFDSEPPITAILAAEHLAQAGLALLKRLQHAHYVEGRRIADVAVLQDCAAAIGLAREVFAQRYHALQGAATLAHVQQSRDLLAQVGGRGFPTLVLQRGNSLHVLPWSQFLGKPPLWRNYLLEQLTLTHVDTDAASPACTVEGNRC